MDDVIEADGAVSNFSDSERDLFYRILASRRDIRKFRPDPVPDEVLGRILQAAHAAGSVGFMQPWNFILVRDPVRRQAVKDSFLEVTEAAAQTYSGDRQTLYRSLKLEGLTESPLNLCVTCDTRRGGPHVLGRHSIPETDVYSTCLAVQNLWLAARVEGVGVGWVSIVINTRLREFFGLPEAVIPVAYLCVGYPQAFPTVPELQTAGWRDRLPLRDLVLHECWPEESVQ